MKIRLRIALWIAAAGLLSSLLFSLVVFYEMAEQPLQLLDNELKMAGTSLIERLAENPPPETTVTKMGIPDFTAGYWIRVYGKNQQLLYQSKLASQIDLPVKKRRHRFTVQVKVPQKNLHLHQDNWNNVAFRVRVLKRTVNNIPFLVQVARPMEKFDEEIVDLIIFLVLGLTASTILLLLLSYFAAGQVQIHAEFVGRFAQKGPVRRHVSRQHRHLMGGQVVAHDDLFEPAQGRARFQGAVAGFDERDWVLGIGDWVFGSGDWGGVA
jgi:hypothetical protein